MDPERWRHALVPVRDGREAALIASSLVMAVLAGLAIPAMGATRSIIAGVVLAALIILGCVLWQRRRPRVSILAETLLLVGDAPELELIAAQARAPCHAEWRFLARRPTMEVRRVPDVATAAGLVRGIACREMVVADREFSDRTRLRDCRGYAVRTVRISEKLAQLT